MKLSYWIAVLAALSAARVFSTEPLELKGIVVGKTTPAEINTRFDPEVRCRNINLAYCSWKTTLAGEEGSMGTQVYNGVIYKVEFTPRSTFAGEKIAEALRLKFGVGETTCFPYPHQNICQWQDDSSTLSTSGSVTLLHNDLDREVNSLRAAKEAEKIKAASQDL